ncbi:isoprenylcysteine carboxylmethyltransferase family protein [Nocardia uniformis]|uniref:Isoprenylcysteine carboxylmethyltransferase family protein n=1 Tax=Nocardia uniformis TaxID=53432 RepID=A0A849C698_9NOCA|nr:isoprenylcysteine carboxylmethyltransferase family protein [Nocardia uniformis]NNH71357.1 isoprenylcysteine carboxylmethyltransferase family protein [Nocardia uniformis]
MAFNRSIDIGIVGAIHSVLLLVIFGRMLIGLRTRPPARVESAVTTAPRADAAVASAIIAMVVYYAVFTAWVVRPSLAGPLIIDPAPWSAISGIVLAVASIALIVWTFMVFGSWRLRAEIDSDHELMTGGPFTLIRHPIYTGVIGTFASTLLVVPRVGFIVAVLLIVVAHDWRARTEEGVLRTAFGDRYSIYIGHTKRFFPVIY